VVECLYIEWCTVLAYSQKVFRVWFPAFKDLQTRSIHKKFKEYIHECKEEIYLKLGRLQEMVTKNLKLLIGS